VVLGPTGVVKTELKDPLAEAILRGEVLDGTTVKVDEGEGKLVLGAGAAPAAKAAAESEAAETEAA
jgi:hypothetical protein